MITPEQIALGAGDDYLLQLNDFFATHGLPAYIRPLGEPNRCLNVWSAVNCDGSQKGGEHTTGWYKQAFRRIAAIVRGGQTLEGINATLAEIGLPPLNRTKGPEPGKPAGGAGEHHLEPAAGRLAAGERQLPRQLLARQPLGRLGRHRLLLPVSRLERPQPLLRRQAVAAASRSRSPSGRSPAIDEPRFVKQLVAWIVKRPRVRMLVYYTGFGPGNHYDLSLYPRTTNTLRLKIRRASFLAYAEYNAGLLPPLPPKPKKTTPKPAPVPTPRPNQPPRPSADGPKVHVGRDRPIGGWSGEEATDRLGERRDSCSICSQVQWETRQPASCRRCSRRRSSRKAESVSWNWRLSASTIRPASRQRKSGLKLSPPIRASR